MPMDVPLLIRGVYNTLRKPRARANLWIYRHRLVFGVGDLHGLAVLRQMQDAGISASMPRERGFQHFVASGFTGVKAAR